MPTPDNGSIRTYTAIAQIDPTDWDRLAGDQPFLRHAFLDALETTGCATPETGWTPAHIGLHDHGQLVGAMPLYLKSHSFGEFVFDWGWAEAYQRHGLHYYPKLVAAIPFSPVTGARLLGEPALSPRLVEAAVQLAERQDASSIHCLFPTASQAEALEKQGWLIRTDCQFHWRNRDYQHFDDFLDTFSSAKRKKVRRERRRVAEAGIQCRIVHGDELTPAQLDIIYRFYCMTYLERGRQQYLNRAFFEVIAARLGSALVVILACEDDEPVGTAICFRDRDTLYGRHWGAAQFSNSLHFETCYYQGIDYCIREGLQYFDPGAQGQHKISRGFEPTTTYSAHWIADIEFREAIADFLSRERPMMEQYRAEVREHLPYK